MYKIMLVDDEPLVLTGIKFMIDWKQFDCSIVATARSGRDALQKIEEHDPDIVFCDINMPAMNGIEVLQQAPEYITFIMLTNLQEFSLVQQAIQHRAADYILKTDLDRDTMEQALRRAIAECDSRKTLRMVNTQQEVLRTSREESIRQALTRLFVCGSSVTSSAAWLLGQQHMLDNYFCASLLLPDAFVNNEPTQRSQWSLELFETVSARCFPNCFMLLAPEEPFYVTFFFWDCHCESFEDSLELYHRKLLHVAGEITRVPLHLLVTDRFSGAARLSLCSDALRRLREEMFHTRVEFLKISTGFQTVDLDLTPFHNLILESVRSRNAVALAGHFAQLSGEVSVCRISRSVLCKFCQRLSAGIRETAEDLLADPQADPLKALLEAPVNFGSLDQMMHWLDSLSDALVLLVGASQDSHSPVIRQVKAYIASHIEERLSLQKLAQAVYMSPSYLSSFFKKEEKQNLSDYINEQKILYARELLKRDANVSDIARRLSFDNASYFTRVFKKYTGLSPSEYQRTIGLEDSEG